MKKYIRRTVIIISMLLVICITLGLCQNYLFVLDDHNAWRIRGFYLEDKDSLDVVFLGVSDIYSGIIPSRLYSEYGITSYDFASADSSVSLWKSQVKEILKRQNPQYIVVEINGVVEGDDDVLNDNSGLRRYTDGMPLSWNKIETILNYNPREEIVSFFSH